MNGLGENFQNPNFWHFIPLHPRGFQTCHFPHFQLHARYHENLMSSHLNNQRQTNGRTYPWYHPHSWFWVDLIFERCIFLSGPLILEKKVSGPTHSEWTCSSSYILSGPIYEFIKICLSPDKTNCEIFVRPGLNLAAQKLLSDRWRSFISPSL